jgi:thiamine biosynthesis lipoprotein
LVIAPAAETAEHDTTFPSMGSQVRILVGAPRRQGVAGPEEAAQRERAFIEDYAARLSRFSDASELSALNSDQRPVVPASRLLRTAVAAGLWAAARTGGLVDPTLVAEIEHAGYRTSRAGVAGVPLAEALAAAPARRPATPHAAAAWRAVSVDERNGVVRRPPGVRIDTGGTGKGLAADAVALRLAGYQRCVVDCGGDIAVRGSWEIEVEHPLTGERMQRLRVTDGGVATSGLNVKVWRRDDGAYAHHLLDPSTGEPAWTGLIAATALGGTALEAETLSKMALLSGPRGARHVLERHGGLFVHDDGDVTLVGPVALT